MEATAETKAWKTSALKRFNQLSGPFQEAKRDLWAAMYQERMDMLAHPECEFVANDGLRWVHAKGSDCVPVPVLEEWVDGVGFVPLDRVMAEALVDANESVSWCKCTEGRRR